MCRLDYCNSLLAGIDYVHLQRLQSVQNTAACLVFGTRRHDHITPVLVNLHWLPLRKRVIFKTALWKCVHGEARSYTWQTSVFLWLWQKVVNGRTLLRPAIWWSHELGLLSYMSYLCILFYLRKSAEVRKARTLFPLQPMTPLLPLFAWLRASQILTIRWRPADCDWMHSRLRWCGWALVSS